MLVEVLIWEGFALDEMGPNLQHSKEILDSINRMEALDLKVHWESFHQAMLTAWRLGILWDVSKLEPAAGHTIID